MSDYRKALKEHFESIPAFNSMLKINYIFYGLGLLFLILAAVLSTSSFTVSDLFNGLGMLLLLFGLFLCFVRKDDMGVVISMGVFALFDLIMFIVSLVTYRGFIIQFSYLLYVGAAVWLLVLALRSSGLVKQMQNHQQAAAGARTCVSCGASIAAGTNFCPACGAQQTVKCPQCGATVSSADEFCGGCGNKLK